MFGAEAPPPPRVPRCRPPPPSASPARGAAAAAASRPGRRHRRVAIRLPRGHRGRSPGSHSRRRVHRVPLLLALRYGLPVGLALLGVVGDHRRARPQGGRGRRGRPDRRRADGLDAQLDVPAESREQPRPDARRRRATTSRARPLARGGRRVSGPAAFAVMGIVNVTPDSFSDGGLFLDREAAVAHGLDLAAQGAAYLDIGGESTRPGADPVPADEELRRVVPVIERLVAARGAAQRSRSTHPRPRSREAALERRGEARQRCHRAAGVARDRRDRRSRGRRSCA